MLPLSRTTLHADANAFYVSCEICENPSLRGKPVVVGGDPEARHGIVLAKSDFAKKVGIKTGMVLWQAKQLCPSLIVIHPNYRRYLWFSQKIRAILNAYSDRVEPFGLDEAFVGLYGDTIEQGVKAAHEIRERVKRELGITVSVGVADNRIMAKLGSDYQKPDAVTRIAPEDYPTIAWPLPVEELLYVGPATKARLNRSNIWTIGQLAHTPREHARAMLGKNGDMLWVSANGLDRTPVAHMGDVAVAKSIGNSTTTPRDLVCDEDVRMTVFLLAESVAERLREQGMRASTIELWMRNSELGSITRQVKRKQPTQLSGEIAGTAMDLFARHHSWAQEPKLRSIGVRGSGLVSAMGDEQVSMFGDEELRGKWETLEAAIDGIRGRFGHFAIQRGMMLVDRRLTDLSPRDDHIQIFPMPYVR